MPVVTHIRRDLDWGCPSLQKEEAKGERDWWAGAVRCVTALRIVLHHWWVSCEHVTTLGLVVATQGHFISCRGLHVLKKIKFSITNRTAVLLLFLSADMKERACLHPHPFYPSIMPQGTWGIFRATPPSLFCSPQDSKKSPLETLLQS